MSRTLVNEAKEGRHVHTTMNTLGRGGCPQVSAASREGDPTARFEPPPRAVKDNGPYLAEFSLPATQPPISYRGAAQPQRAGAVVSYLLNPRLFSDLKFPAPSFLNLHLHPFPISAFRISLFLS